jgi:hypothetical protein
MPGLRGTPAVTITRRHRRCRVVLRTLVARVEAVDRRRFGDVETLALRNSLGDVEEDDVPELLQADQVGERAADLAGPDQRDLLPRHDWILPPNNDRSPVGIARSLKPLRETVQAEPAALGRRFKAHALSPRLEWFFAGASPKVAARSKPVKPCRD